MEIRFRINQLSQLVARALDEAAFPQNSARVRDVPDVRTIRYYTTLGLLDRAAEMNGRTALYGPRHLLQIIAIKRLQAEGRSLVEIQQELTGADDATLRRHAKLPAGIPKKIDGWLQESTVQESTEQQPTATSSAARQAPRRARAFRSHFWAQPPQPAAAETEQPPAASIRSAAVIPLAPSVSLLLDGVDVGQLNEQALSGLQPAIVELLNALQSVGLLDDVTTERDQI